MRSRGPLPRNFWSLLGLAAFLIFCFRLTRNAFRGPVQLRILPVGDSLTQGYGSSDDNGYRLFLEKLLLESGHPVDFVGSQSDGYNNLNAAHDGWNGAKIHEIGSNLALHGGLRAHPNIVLVHAGTNDIQWDEEKEPIAGEELEYAHYRLTILLDEIICENPEAVLLVSKVVGQPGNQERVDWFNFFVNDTLTPYREKGTKIKMVDHSGIGQGNGYDLMDKVHPNDAGYHKMALQWFRTIHHLPEDWLTPAKRAAKSLKDRRCQHDDQYWYELNHRGIGGDAGGSEAAAETAPEAQAAVVGDPAPGQLEQLDPAALTAPAQDAGLPPAAPESPGVGREAFPGGVNMNQR